MGHLTPETQYSSGPTFSTPSNTEEIFERKEISTVKTNVPVLGLRPLVDLPCKPFLPSFRNRHAHKDWVLSRVLGLVGVETDQG